MQDVLHRGRVGAEVGKGRMKHLCSLKDGVFVDRFILHAAGAVSKAVGFFSCLICINNNPNC